MATKLKHDTLINIRRGELKRILREKKLLLGIRTIQCMDKTPAEVKAYFRERKRARDRIRKKKLREMRRPDDDISVRARELLGALSWEWIRSTDLAEKLKKRKPFRRL